MFLVFCCLWFSWWISVVFDSSRSIRVEMMVECPVLWSTLVCFVLCSIEIHDSVDSTRIYKNLHVETVETFKMFSEATSQ